MEIQNRLVYEKCKNWDKKRGKNSFYYLQLIEMEDNRQKMEILH